MRTRTPPSTLHPEWTDVVRPRSQELGFHDDLQVFLRTSLLSPTSDRLRLPTTGVSGRVGERAERPGSDRYRRREDETTLEMGRVQRVRREDGGAPGGQESDKGSECSWAPRPFPSRGDASKTGYPLVWRIDGRTRRRDGRRVRHLVTLSVSGKGVPLVFRVLSLSSPPGLSTPLGRPDPPRRRVRPSGRVHVLV